MSTMFTIFVLMSVCTSALSIAIGPFANFADGSGYENPTNSVSVQLACSIEKIWYHVVSVTPELQTLETLLTFDRSSRLWKQEWQRPIEPTFQKVFSLNQRLYSLSYTVDSPKVTATSLQVLLDDQWRPVHVNGFPLELCKGQKEFNDVLISVPTDSMTTVYIGASCFSSSTNGTRMDFHKIVLTTNEPEISGISTHIAGGKTGRNVGLAAMGSRDGVPVTLVNLQRLRQRGFKLNDNLAIEAEPITMQLRERVMSTEDGLDSWSGVGPYVLLGRHLVFSSGVPNGLIDPSHDMRSLSLDLMKWQRLNLTFPTEHQPVFCFDESKLFAVSLTKGIKQAEVTVLTSAAPTPN